MNDSIGTPALYILLALTEGEKHGYAIMKEVSVMSDDEINLGPATLYTNIKRLLLAKLIKEVGHKKDPAAIRPDERRRYYILSSTGRLVVKSELARMEKLVRNFKPQVLSV
ncbi:MAG: helix-turn-helix transcriptional regulator [Patescibacteria group bacterium]